MKEIIPLHTKNSAESDAGQGCGCGSAAGGCCGGGASASEQKSGGFIPLTTLTFAPKPMEDADVRARLEGKKGPEFWRSLNELAQTPEFEAKMQREWKSAPASWQGVSRRDFLKLAGASLAMAGLAGCAKQPEEKIVPYAKQPEEIIPGRPLFFASAASLSGAPGFGYAVGVLAESHMGRPTKIEGNPDHPSSMGGTDSITQATLYTMYDPDRSQKATKNGESSSWDAAKGEIIAKVAKLKGGEGLRILTDSVTSPTLGAQIKGLLKKMPGAKWHVWSPVNNDNQRAAFTAPVDVVYSFDKAKVIVSLDSNFLQDEAGSSRYSRDFANGRRIRTRENKITMNRLYVLESTPTVTGASADHRWPVKASEIGNAAQALAAAVGVTGVAAGKSEEYIGAIADDLKANRGACVVVVGPNQPPAVHAAAHKINAALGNIGKTVQYVKSAEENTDNNLESLTALVADMNAGKVNTLVIIGANPVYTAPADLKFLDALKKVSLDKEKVGLCVRLGLYDDETSNWCNWHVPQRHYLEDWSDARAHDGTASIVQPLIAPLYDGISAHQLISVLAGNGDRNPYNIVREYWTPFFKGDFEPQWRKALNDGIIAGTASKPAVVSAAAVSASAEAAGGGLEINFFPDPTVWDGIHANNGWLQELPKPMTKMTWDNAALVSLKTAREKNLNNYDIVTLSANGGSVEAPIWILPGQPDNQITVHLGYGRTRGGQMADGAGFDAYQLRTSKTLGFGGGADVKATGKQARLGVTQENHTIDNRIPNSPAGLQKQEGNKDTMDSFHARDLIRVLPVSMLSTLPTENAEAREKIGHYAHELLEGKEGHGEGHGEEPAPAEHKEELDRSVGSDYETQILPRVWPSDRKGEDKNGVPTYDQDKKWYNGEKIPAWSMTIDLNVCLGCNGCTVACQAENNISIVGKDEVIRGREMHWMRLDRYYRGDVANPEMHSQPVACMQCEKAPCEPVCPVEATTHSVEGLNEMTYNRCVGTKYCSNNCPYKVRRFNFLQYSEQDNNTLQMMKNPDVTVRSRGVMEKCTFCVQRINEARTTAEKEGRAIKDGEFQTACQQGCPTNAIIFGNVNDTQSEVYKTKAEPHNYSLLPELNTFPRLTYLAKFHNKNPKIKEA